MQVNKRAWVVVGGLAAAAALMLVAFNLKRNGGDSEVVGAIAKTSSRDTAVAGAGNQAQGVALFDLRSLRRVESTKVHTSDLLAPKSWYAPPPPPAVKAAVAVAPPPPPSPPQMPFSYIGKMIDGKRVVIFLLKNDVQYVAQLDDVLDGTYRVAKISDNDVVLTYIPMNAQQTLELKRDTPGAATIQLADRMQGIAATSLQPARQGNPTPFVKQ